MLTLGSSMGEVIPVVAIACTAGVAVISIIMGTVTSATKTRQRERTKRELAAYVAEGSMTPDEAERILKAEPEGGACGKK
ncbi:MAG: hypothetical protein KDA05_00630 [Phycisphaerales bacterium]|nr:hypothetical protein [Phycisphaerales bacterium]